MNVLSLFDGMSCGQQAFERQGIKVDTYYASEIDKHAIKITQKNYPNTIQLGSVVNVDVSKLGWIDVLIGGSPCQSFSFAGKRKGMSTKDEIEILTIDQYLELKEQNFDFEGQSYLFWEYMRVLTDIRKTNPDVKFLLENVLMGEKWEKVLSRAICVNPIEINSALVSAQNRRRLYWTNIGMKTAGLFGDLESTIKQPKDRGILLKHILESEVDEKYFLSDKMLNYLNTRKANYNSGKLNLKHSNDKGSCINASSGSIDISDNLIVDVNGKARCFTAGGNSGGLHSQMDLVKSKVIQLNEAQEFGGQPRQQNRVYSTEGQGPALCIGSGGLTHNILLNEATKKGGTDNLSRNDGKTYCLAGNTNAVEVLNQSRIGGYTINERGIRPHKGDVSKSGISEFGTILFDTSKTDTLTTVHQPLIFNINSFIRRLTPTECERLQTVKDGYTEGVSDTQRYRMLGNGWTIEVISHILSYLEPF